MGAVESVNANTPAPDVPIAPADVPMMSEPAPVEPLVTRKTAADGLTIPV